MELQKQLERNHYNKQAGKILEKKYVDFNWNYGSKRFGLILGRPFRIAERRIEEIIKNKEKKGEITKFLDYGCGIGVHSIFPAKCGAEVYGIDISQNSIEIAKQWARQENINEKTFFLVMDCENLKFPENFFDIIFNCGTLSCIDRQRAYLEIIRVLKPDGYFISIDTLGHNPFLNLNRKIKLKRGMRTSQTVDNILKMEDIAIAKQYFRETEVYFFHLTSLSMIPFQKLSIFSFLGRILESMDRLLFNKSFLQKYAFKVMFILSFPKK